ncbi:hypothetical protein B484DRAFT_447759 [Ochromonadaceae sp. CCMP2298]|nr:hypothetical protein B484DRAFT_447759 [Ochromonadaceae sp. CCMP2298]
MHQRSEAAVDGVQPDAPHSQPRSAYGRTHRPTRPSTRLCLCLCRLSLCRQLCRRHRRAGPGRFFLQRGQGRGRERGPGPDLRCRCYYQPLSLSVYAVPHLPPGAALLPQCGGEVGHYPLHPRASTGSGSGRGSGAGSGRGGTGAGTGDPDDQCRDGDGHRGPSCNRRSYRCRRGLHPRRHCGYS